MFEKLAVWYLQHLLKKNKTNNLEFVIRDNNWTYARRNKNKEESVKQTFNLIK